VQASSQHDQLASDTACGSVFLCYWLKKQQDRSVKVNVKYTPMLGMTLGLPPEVHEVDVSVAIKVFASKEF